MQTIGGFLQELIDSVSCSANAEYLSHGLKELLTLGKIGINFNIHFYLTYKGPIDFQNVSLYDLKLREFEEQIRVLHEHNVPITSVDGHQHVHLLPFFFKY